MKLQNMGVIFLIIVIPIVLLLSYYISLQVDTLNMQASYNEKLLESAKQAIASFEINTVEWNEAYSETADSKRRDIMASINTFINSFANGMGMGGINKEYILPYIPALAYTLYDGYYIYSPTETKETVKDSNGVTVFMTENLSRDGSITGNYRYKSEDNGKILYLYDGENGASPDGIYDGTYFTLNADNAKATYSHILKPFSSYSARYARGSNDIVVNYTLDNYVTIYGNVNEKYVAKSGYFINTSNINNMPVMTWRGIQVKGIEIDLENLNERIAWKWKENDNYQINIYPYVYSSDNTKVYFEGNTPFQVSSNGIRTNLADLTSVKYKKLVILKDKSTGECIEIYQALTNSKDGQIIQGHWYSETNKPEEVTGINDINSIGLQNDVSSINYYIASYGFTTWVKNNLNNITVDNMLGEKDEINIRGRIFNDNEDPESKESVFSQHKREVIKQGVISSLNQSITSYSRNSAGEYRLPVLTETDWDQILSNVSIIAFVQNIPIGLKYYNNYVVATSTRNKEYVDPDEIYLNEEGDIYYHLPYCNKIGSGNLIGYRSIDYIEKSYNENQYYYRHSDTNTSQEADYYCLVQRSLYNDETKTANKVKAYETALARERYVARSFK